MGCEYCAHTGYAGRQAAAEVLVLDDGLRRLIEDGASPHELEHHVAARGHVSLADAGRAMVAAGVTDISEFKRVLS